MVVWFFRNITENKRQLRFHVNLRTVGQKNKWTVGQKGRKGGKDSFSPEEKKLWVVRLQPSSSKFGLLIKHLTFSCNIMCDNLLYNTIVDQYPVTLFQRWLSTTNQQGGHNSPIFFMGDWCRLFIFLFIPLD